MRLDYRFKLLLFFTCALAVAFAGYTGYSALNTFNVLDKVEAERDHWQRPADVIEALILRTAIQSLILDAARGTSR